MPPAILDTDTLSAIMRRHPIALERVRAYLSEHHHLTFSLMTRYEVLRGLMAKRAEKQQAAFERFCEANCVLPLSKGIIHRAAVIYANLHHRGLLVGDADILIAATALEHGLVLTTNNTNHFNRIDGLKIQNWLVA